MVGPMICGPIYAGIAFPLRSRPVWVLMLPVVLVLGGFRLASLPAETGGTAEQARQSSE